MKLIERISLKTAVKCTSLTACVCAAAIIGTVVIVNLPEKEDGQGGYDTNSSRGVDPVFQADADNSDGELIETSAESALGKNAAFNNKSDSSASSFSASNSNVFYFTYRIKKGDIAGQIAEKFGISTDSILSFNHIKNARGLQIGQYLKIPTMSGILYTTKKSDETISKIAEKYEVDASGVASANNIAMNASLPVGTTLFVTNAAMDWAERQEINGDLFKKPIKSAFRISSHYGWRNSPFSGGRSHHTGVDMACPTGTSVYAAVSGTVTSTGYSPTYGNYVIVHHHSGYKTLYGHLSAILCVNGQRVDQNTRIGRVGSTGLSTGPHLHFSVYKNNALVNPELLWY